MRLEEFLKEKKDALLRQWYDHILETYPPETARFLKHGNNEFTNPVGQSFRDGMSGLLDAVISHEEGDGVDAFLDRIIRIRAVQDFSPSRALSFMPGLKGIVRELLGERLNDPDTLVEYVALERRIDELTFRAFDIFMECREKIYELKANEMRNWTYRLLERVNESFGVEKKD